MSHPPSSLPEAQAQPPVLYVSYDGMLEPLGESQVLNYLTGLSQQGWRFHLISFEKPDLWANTAAVERIRGLFAAVGVEWHPLPYHKKPPLVSTAIDVRAGRKLAGRLIRQHGIRLVHCRSYVSAMIGLWAKRKFNTRFLFDIRGFWPEEKLDAGTYSAGSPIYKMIKRYERQFFAAADRIVTLTRTSKRIIDEKYIAAPNRGGQDMCWVIPTCTNFEAFSPAAEPFPRAEMGIPDAAPVLGYVGSVGTFYHFEHVARAFALAQQRRPDTWLVVVNRHDHAYITQQLTAAGANTAQCVLRGAAFRDVPRLMRTMDASVFFIKASYSKQASAPTRLGELLGCGVPVITNKGYGDVAEIIPNGPVGVLTDGFSDAELDDALTRLETLLASTPRPQLADRCNRTARHYFSLEDGVRDYNALYRITLG